MDKILKFLDRLTEKERNILLEILSKIKNNQLDGLDVKKLINEDNLYRIRKGNIRIVFHPEQKGNTIINIDYRGNIYK